MVRKFKFTQRKEKIMKYQTEQRQKLLNLFKNNHHHSFSATDILSEFKDEDISISAIYRNLKDMEKEGLICKIAEKGRSEAVYHYVDPDSCVGIIHLKCESCDNIYHLNKHISNMLIGIANDEHNFSINHSGAFLYGKCENCSQINTK